ncbi:MAG: hypothetical protein ACK4WH_02815 [Phycisphaerales bacterium]
MKLQALVATLAFITTVALNGSTHQPTIPSPDPTPGPLSDVFEVRFSELSLNARRVMHPSVDSPRPGSSGTLSISLTLTDRSGRLVYRVADDAVIESVIDDRGKELIQEQSGQRQLRLTQPTLDRTSRLFIVPGLSDADGAASLSPRHRTFLASLPVETPVFGVRRIAGRFVVDVVTEQRDYLVSIPGVEQPIEVCPGMIATVKALEHDTSGNLIRCSIEFLTLLKTGPTRSTEIAVVEVLDENCTLVGTLPRRDDYDVGDQRRTRFIVDALSNPDRGSSRVVKPSPVKRIRVTVYSGIQKVRVPFEFASTPIFPTQEPR